MHDDIAYLREHFSYDGETGCFVKIKRTGKKGAIGPYRCLGHSAGYLIVAARGKKFYAHRVAWALTHGEWPEFIDHINGDQRDNRLANLRSVDHTGNMQNIRAAKRGNTHGYMGVSFCKKLNKWRARIVVSRKEICIGHFDDPSDANDAYIEAKRRLHATCSI